MGKVVGPPCPFPIKSGPQGPQAKPQSSPLNASPGAGGAYAPRTPVGRRVRSHARQRRGGSGRGPHGAGGMLRALTTTEAFQAPWGGPGPSLSRRKSIELRPTVRTYL